MWADYIKQEVAICRRSILFEEDSQVYFVISSSNQGFPYSSHSQYKLIVKHTCKCTEPTPPSPTASGKLQKKSIDHNKQPAKADIGRLITCERSSLQPRLDSRLRLRKEDDYGSYSPEMPFGTKEFQGSPANFAA